LEPTLPGVVLRFGLVHSVPPVQVSDMVACGGCFSVAVGLAIVSEVAIGPITRVIVLSATVFVVFFVVKDRHFGNFGFIRAMVLPNCYLGLS
jgi:hypothetical protein